MSQALNSALNSTVVEVLYRTMEVCVGAGRIDACGHNNGFGSTIGLLEAMIAILVEETCHGNSETTKAGSIHHARIRH
jgi:hypothetical protein